MGRLVFGAVLLVASFFVLLAAASLKGNERGRSGAGATRLVGLALAAFGAVILLSSAIVVIDAGTVGVRHAFGRVDMRPLHPGVRVVAPWSEIERYSTREEQFPVDDNAEQMAALSAEQMAMQVEVAVRWQIDPAESPRIFREIGTEDQIRNVVRNAVRDGVRDGIVQFSINDISQRNRIAAAMELEVDSALVTRPRGGGEPFRVAEVTAFFLRDLQPPAQVVQAINSKIAQEQQIATERHRVEVARLQAEQQRLLNQTLTPEALTKQYLEVLHDMRTSNNTVVLVPTEGGVPLLDIGSLRRTLQTGQSNRQQ